MIINLNGQKIEIVNWEEFSRKLLFMIGSQLDVAFGKEIDKLNLVDTGFFKRGFTFDVDGNSLIISNDAPYAVYLEYGTYAYWNKFGADNYPQNPDPKKKDLDPAERKNYPKGMQPFAVMRKTLWNQNRMASIINKAVKVASR